MQMKKNPDLDCEEKTIILIPGNRVVNGGDKCKVRPILYIDNKVIVEVMDGEAIGTNFALPKKIFSSSDCPEKKPAFP